MLHYKRMSHSGAVNSFRVIFTISGHSTVVFDQYIQPVGN